MGIIELFATLFSLGSLSVIATEWITKFTKLHGTMAQIQSWVISIVIGILCAWLNFGLFNGTSTIGGVLYGILIGLISNGIFDMEFVKRLLEMIRLRTTKKEVLLKS